ncbi:SCP2 domain-containing protein [Rugamonas sp. CCM 8940]|uniref:ubiquinone biosynthesis accessory factor UbiJ n=1 Tax=Rugamonas sp. CCM 8940 TaxID=2765359 RepID=UPI0018F3B237|nr:SCP2 sterol-binding domain-containing protein [Rugamonas sp. CCM 8940]MBJ7310339.1 SCP2 sterol-binding domain-containing protein [Rugamonas sp. CCM 8940]
MTPPNSSHFPSLPDAAAPVIATVNHLLAQEPWARRELLRHAGKVACVDAGSLALRLRVGGDGLLEAAPAEQEAAVTIRVKLSDLPLILRQRERAFSYVKIDGDAEFANAISSLSKSLRWEAEHDLEKVIGPVAAVRVVAGAKAAFGAVKAGQRKLAENLAEYFLDEQPMLLRPAVVAAFSADVARLRDDVERAAKRLAKLEQKLAARAAATPPQHDTDPQ